MKCSCGRKMWFQPSLFDQTDGHYICVKCGRSQDKKQTAKQPKRLAVKKTKVIDYAALQDRVLHYAAKKAELHKQIQQQGSDQDLTKELAWCEFVQKQKMKDLGLLGFVEENHIQI